MSKDLNQITLSSVICYENADREKVKIIGENKGKSGVYC